MTKEEAIASYEKLYTYMVGDDDAIELDYGEFMELNHYIRSALRPVSRERMEKVFHGCEMCREKKKVKSDNFCGAATMQIVGDSIDLCGDKKKIKFFGHIYAPSFSVKFCPFCGKPLTDEAVDMVMERMEAMHNDL